jgi:hypothetical protein
MLERSLKTLDVMANHERCSGTFICGSSASIYELFDENARHSDRMMMMEGLVYDGCALDEMFIAV